MSDDLDPRLLARFSAVRAKPLDAQFVALCLARLEADRRRQLLWRVALWGAGGLLLAWQLRRLLAFTAGVADQMVSTLIVPAVHVASGPPGLSAAGWCVSLLLGAWVLWRTPSLRRRR